MAPTPKNADVKVDTKSEAATIESAKKQKLERLSFDGIGELVTFIIGPNKAKFPVHKKFVVHVSPVLKAAFESQMIEGQTQTYTLEDTTERAFALFVQWAYTQTLDIQPKDTRSLNEVVHEGDAFFELWVLADKLLVRPLQNLTISLIDKMQITHNVLWVNNTQYIYKNTSSDSPLRRLLIDQMVHGLGEDTCKKSAVFLIPEAWLDLTCALFKEMSATARVHSRVASDYYVKED